MGEEGHDHDMQCSRHTLIQLVWCQLFGSCSNCELTLYTECFILWLKFRCSPPRLLKSIVGSRPSQPSHSHLLAGNMDDIACDVSSMSSSVRRRVSRKAALEHSETASSFGGCTHPPLVINPIHITISFLHKIQLSVDTFAFNAFIAMIKYIQKTFQNVIKNIGL
jgi:hypothetical protein